MDSTVIKQAIGCFLFGLLIVVVLVYSEEIERARNPTIPYPNFVLFVLTVLGVILGIDRIKRDPNSTCVDSALENLTKKSILGYNPEWTAIRVGLGFIKSFLTFVPKWSKADEGVREHLGDLLSSIEDAFKEAGRDIEGAIKKGESELLDAVRSNLLAKIQLFKPRITESYVFLSEYAFRVPRSPPVPDADVWFELFISMFTNALNLRSERRLSNPLYLQFEDFMLAIRPFIERYIGSSNDGDQLRDLGNHLGGVGICLARLLALCWVDETDENNTGIMLAHLMHRIKPSTPQLRVMYFKSIKSKPNHSEKFLSQELAEIILFPSKDSFPTLHDGLAFLIMHLLQSPDNHLEDVERMKSEMEKVICDAARLNYCSSSKTQGEDELALFQVLQKVELLRVELVLKLLTGDGSISKEIFESIYNGLKFLQTFIRRPRERDSGMLTQIFESIKEIAREAESVHQSMQAAQLEKGYTLKSKLLPNFKFRKIQAFLMEQLRCSPSSTVAVKGQIEKLNERSKLFYKYSSILPLENPSDMELILIHMDSMAKEAENLDHFLCSSQVKDHTLKDLSLLLSNFLEKIDLLNAELQGTYLQFQSSSVLSLPKMHQGLGFVDLFLERLSKLMKCKADLIPDSAKHQIKAALRELVSLRSSLDNAEQKKNKNPVLKDLPRRVTWAAYQADYIIDWILQVNSDGCHMLWLSDVIDEMKVIKTELIKITDTTSDSHEAHNANSTSKHLITKTDTPKVREVVVTLEDQEKILTDRLTRGSPRRQVVTIVGMPGLGKTTLAQKVYNNSVVKHYFHRHAWCCVSQAYRRRELLLKILSDITETTGEIREKSDQELHKMTDDELLNMLYKRLKGNRYLIVLDDVWDTQIWEELRTAFPDDLNRSRVLFTSRYDNVALEADGALHHLRSLNEDESWQLLQKILFHEDKYPVELIEVGRAIAKSCKGLPLAVVAVAGLLRGKKTKAEWWKQIDEDLNSCILEDPENQCMHILELSYNHLPDDLKPCFLYFAAFEEDSEVPIHKVIRLWIAEGFIRKVDQKTSPEDVAEGYVMDLISRSLLLAARIGSNGGLKACKVHDMLHNLCLRKAQEEKFLASITGYEKLFPSSTSRLDYGVDLEYPSNSVAYRQHRLSICSKRNHFVMLKPSGPPVRTLLFLATSDRYPRCPYDVSFISHSFKLLRVLDIESINMGTSFPEGIELLEPLRYLAVGGDLDSVPATISKLWNLETFIVQGLRGKVTLPDSIWRMPSLRHLHVNTSVIFSLQDENLGSSSRLDNLVTLSSPVLLVVEDTAEKILKKFPELRKLRCTFSEPVQPTGNCIRFPDLKFLAKLESLKILYSGSTSHSCQFSIPMNLKKLSLSDFSLTWDCLTTIGTLPKLEVLKLVSIAFDSPTWEMRENEFGELKVLKLYSLKIVNWSASSDHLPSLQRLVLRSCKQLQEVPSSFGESTTLQMVVLKWCSTSAENSVTAIREQQLEYGNEEFQTFINVSAGDFRPF